MGDCLINVTQFSYSLALARPIIQWLSITKPREQIYNFENGTRYGCVESGIVCEDDWQRIGTKDKIK